MPATPQTDHDSEQGASTLPATDAAEITFIDDPWLAKSFKGSVSTIRSQRYKRRHGLPHWLDIDPVMFGSMPRYRLSDVVAWLKKRGSALRNG